MADQIVTIYFLFMLQWKPRRISVIIITLYVYAEGEDVSFRTMMKTIRPCSAALWCVLSVVSAVKCLDLITYRTISLLTCTSRME